MATDPSSDPDYQVGAHDVDSEEIDFGSGSEFVEFELEARAVFKRLAEDIYENAEAGVREPLTNSATAVKRAIEKTDLPKEQGVIEITTQRHTDNGAVLTIRDNGIGITESELNEVLAVVGRSTNRDREDLAGQFGMGFLAIWMLAGLDGGFIMSTNSRLTDADPITGVWKSGGFSRDTDGVLDSLNDDEYGTRLEINLKEGIQADDVREWVEKYAEWCRIPVIFREFDEDGREVFNEDYGDKTLGAEYPDDDLSLVYDTEFFRAVCTNTSTTEQTILLDVPVQRNKGSVSNIPFKNLDIRMKNENGVVVAGPNRGKLPVSRNEYREKSDDAQQKFIPETELRGDDIVMPGPTGTRDKLDEADEFWNWLGDEFWDIYYDEVADLYRRFDSLDDVLSLSKHDFKLVLHSIPNLNKASKSFADSIVEECSLSSFNTDLAEKLTLLQDTIELAPRDTAGVSDSSNREDTTVWKVLYDAQKMGRDGDVYMGVSLNQEKAIVAWEDNKDSRVVRVDGTGQYAVYEEAFGWKKLKDISKSNIDDFDISDSTRKLFTESRGSTTTQTPKSVQDRLLTLHFSRRRNTEKVTVGNIESEFTKIAEGKQDVASFGFKSPETIVFFPTSAEKNVSSYYWLTSDDVAVATCANKVWSHLSDIDGLHHINDYLDRATSIEFQTSNGVETLDSAPENLALHVVDESTVDLFRDSDRMELAEEYLVENTFVDGYHSENLDEVCYAPITDNEYRRLRPGLRDAYVVTGDLFKRDIGDSYSIPNDTQLYAYIRLHEWRGTSEFDVMQSIDERLTEEGYDIVETMGMLHDAGVAPNSVSGIE